MADENEYEQRQKVGFKMRKCPLCDKKIREDAKFCSECGWDLTDHELTLLQMARIQEDIQDARFRAMQVQTVVVLFATIGIICSVLGFISTLDILPTAWGVMVNIAWPFCFTAVLFAAYQDRYRKKKNRLKMMLRDRQPSQ
jgi:hypothetical protein